MDGIVDEQVDQPIAGIQPGQVLHECRAGLPDPSVDGGEAGGPGEKHRRDVQCRKDRHGPGQPPFVTAGEHEQGENAYAGDEAVRQAGEDGACGCQSRHRDPEAGGGPMG